MKKHKIFKTNPHLKEVHSTSDGELFYNENDAKMHAKTLEDKKVELITNPDLLEVTAEVVSEEDEEKAAAEKLAQEKAAAEKLAEEKAAAEKLAEEKAAAEKVAQEKAAADKKNTKK